MPLIFALAYHVLVGFVDVAIKGRLKQKYGWENLSPFWKSLGGGIISWEPILFGTSFVISLTLLLVSGHSLLLCFKFGLYTLLLGVSGFESIMYWWIGGIFKLDKKFWEE